MPRDIDIVIEQVRALNPDATIEQLKVTHPADDDDGLWFFGFLGLSESIQVESSLGSAPFTIEHSNMKVISDAIRDASIEQTVREVTKYLGMLKARANESAKHPTEPLSPIHESIALVPDIEMNGLHGARTLWDSRPGLDAEWGMLCWNDRRFWFAIVCYDEKEKMIWHSVSPLTDEQARILDDWYVQFRLLSNQWQILANDPATARGLALKEKGRQVNAIAAVRPTFEALPIVGRFSVSDYGSAGKPKDEKNA